MEEHIAEDILEHQGESQYVKQGSFSITNVKLILSNLAELQGYVDASFRCAEAAELAIDTSAVLSGHTGRKEQHMTDKNGVEIKTGSIVEITGAYFKNDNGLYFVTNSPGDPSWSGFDHCLTKISRRGKISKAKYNLCFWPIGVFVSDRTKRAEAHQWNREHATIEVKAPLQDMSEVAAYFQSKADDMTEYIRRGTYDWGEEHPSVQKNKAIQAHYAAVAQTIREGAAA